MRLWRAAIEGREALLLARQSRELLLQRVRGRRRCALVQAHEFGEVGGERLGLDAQLRQHGAEQHRGADRLQHVLRPHEHGRRRPAAHALQGGEDLDDDAAPASSERRIAASLPVSVSSALLQAADALFGRRACAAAVSMSAALSFARSASMLGDLGLELALRLGARGERLLRRP